MLIKHVFSNMHHISVIFKDNCALGGDKRVSPRASVPEYVQFVCFASIFVILSNILDLEVSKSAKKMKNATKNNEFETHLLTI